MTVFSLRIFLTLIIFYIVALPAYANGRVAESVQRTARYAIDENLQRMEAAMTATMGMATALVKIETIKIAPLSELFSHKQYI